MRRLLLVNALIFAVLAAAVALAYYGYSYTSEVSSRDRELELMHDLAIEKVLNIESLIGDADSKLLREVSIEPKSEQLGELVKTTGAAVVSVFVLDDQLRLVPNGNVSSRPQKDGVEFRDWFIAHAVPHLPLADQPVGVRGHRHAQWERNGAFKPFLFSFMKRVSGDRTFYVVVEDDLSHLTLRLFPQFFAVSTSPRFIYQVLDESGALVYGAPFEDASGLVVEVPFAETVDGWVLRVAEKDAGSQAAIERKHLIDSLLIGGAVGIILLGLVALGLAIRRERRLNDLKSEFISNVSHELKTPLSIISMFGELLATGRTKSSEQAHEYSEIIWRESLRLGRLIDNVLDFAKIERGMGAYEFVETDVGEVVDRALELSQRRVAAAEMTLEAEIEPDLPAAPLDANAFTLAVLNLIDNAIKYAADGKRIQVTLTRDPAAKHRVVLAVRDWGQGIDPEEHERIFERFYRAKTIRLKPIRGSGIGLALVRHIVHAHHGDVSVESAPGQGSTFRISLPISDTT
ncbi:MAG: HAMP domain-containing sensor histidine kinase [Proteobacteria bacterium]|nr:HAMP domain-containing sensor histidine kinase [Pseudomonadota bacterium]